MGAKPGFEFVRLRVWPPACCWWDGALPGMAGVGVEPPALDPYESGRPRSVVGDFSGGLIGVNEVKAKVIRPIHYIIPVRHTDNGGFKEGASLRYPMSFRGSNREQENRATS